MLTIAANVAALSNCGTPGLEEPRTASRFFPIWDVNSFESPPMYRLVQEDRVRFRLFVRHAIRAARCLWPWRSHEPAFICEREEHTGRKGWMRTARGGNTRDLRTPCLMVRYSGPINQAKVSRKLYRAVSLLRRHASGTYDIPLKSLWAIKPLLPHIFISHSQLHLR